jgi:hypothetical protein
VPCALLSRLAFDSPAGHRLSRRAELTTMLPVLGVFPGSVHNELRIAQI